MRTTFLIIGIIIFSTACVTQYADESEIKLDLEGMSGLIVPDGFDYEMYQKQALAVSFSGSAQGRLSDAQSLQYAIIGEDFEGEIHGLSSGHTNLEEGINLKLIRPIHIQQLYLYTKYVGNARFFEINDESFSLDLSDLIIDESVFHQGNARVASVPTCKSFLGNATKIHCRDRKIVIQSSASFQHIDIEFVDGKVNTYYPGEAGSLNANNNIWTFTDALDGYSLSDMSFFTVYADCKTSPKSVGLELVKFANPCQYEVIDSDGDGVSDESDVQPNDENVSSVVYVPARDRYATFAFEDMWPYKGDFDFNDLVISHNATVYTNAQNFVTKVNYDFVIRAIGAKFSNDLCLSFSDPNGTISVDQIKPEGLSYELFHLRDISEIRFTRFKELFGTEGFVNTDTTKSFKEPISVSMVLLFDGTLKSEEFNIDEYLRINQEEGREVHKPGQPFTSLMDESMLGFAADDTSPAEDKYFKTEDNLPWVLEIPSEWEYPKESIEITKGYPKFKDFAQGKRNTPWYTDADGNKIHKHLYKKK